MKHRFKYTTEITCLDGLVMIGMQKVGADGQTHIMRRIYTEEVLCDADLQKNIINYMEHAMDLHLEDIYREMHRVAFHSP